MKNRAFYLSFILFVVAFTACRKSIVDQAYVTTYTLPCTVRGVDMIDVIFVTKQIPEHTSVYVYFRNASSTPISNAKIFIEMCGAVPQNYDNCQHRWTINIDSLPVNDTTGYQQINGPELLLVNPQFAIDSSHVTTGIINYDTLSNNNPLAGSYQTDNYTTTWFTTTKNSIYLYANGYVFFDGTSIFRFKYTNNAGTYYNAYGNCANDTSFSGYLVNSGGTQVSTLSLSSKSQIDSLPGTFKCVLNINTPVFDSINAININLGK